MEYIFPNIDEQYHYSRGSSSLIAASFLATINAFGAVAVALNRITKLFSKYFPQQLRTEIDVSWMGALDNVAQWRDLYPAFEECKGESEPSAPSANPQTTSFDSSKVAGGTSTVPVAPTTTAAGQQQATTNNDVNKGKGSFAGFNVSENPFDSLGAAIPISTGTHGGFNNPAPSFNQPPANKSNGLDPSSFLSKIMTKNGPGSTQQNNGFNQGFNQQNQQGFNRGFNQNQNFGNNGFNQGFNNGGFSVGSL